MSVVITAVSKEKNVRTIASAKLLSKISGYCPPTTGIFRILPTSWIPYAELMRLDRPAGWYAFYWHYAIGLAFAACIASPIVSLTTLAALAGYLAVWVVVLRGAVCAWNDNLDQEFDRKVTRTRFRPIARGAVSTTQGHIFTAAQLVLEAIMLTPLPAAASVYAALGTLVLIVYPLGKRFTDFPQVILGFGFAIPIYMCCAAVGVDLFDSGKVTDRENITSAAKGATEGAACLYFACALWTIIFDTIYAHQDLKDDVKAGVKGLAVCLGDRTKLACGIMAAVQISLLVAAGIFCDLSFSYFAISCGGAAMTLCAMLVLVDLKSSASCAWWFGPGSKLVGASIVAGLLSHYTQSITRSGLLTA